ncbi:MAG: M23 family metallopeptidase [Bacteroidota bacterium]|nr:M23 family metallopeptidase [Bacteroidota bacterium]
MKTIKIKIGFWMMIILILHSLTLFSQQPDYVFVESESDSPEQCVSPEETVRLRFIIDSINQELKRNGVFEKYFDAQRRGAPPLFQWPMRQADGFNDPSYYALSNYVDLDPTSPGVLDYNGLNQTYDGHTGIDIRISPYFWLKKQNNQVEAVAAADGVISFWQDDNFDDNCSCTGTWNAVFLTHADGSITWYGHLKSNTLTTKTIGDFVAVGEYIGLIGSSGCSTNPHLHFETYDSGGNLIEPFAGPSNSTTVNSWWANQLPYYDSGINKIATHSTAPTAPACPGIEVPNEKDVFDPGEAITFSIAVRHSLSTDSAKLEVFEPDGDTSTILDLTYIRTVSFFQRAILPTWSRTLANNAPKGKWLFKATNYSVTYGTQVVNKNFWVAESCQANIVHSSNLSVNAYYQASNTISSTSVIINNAQIIYDAENIITLSPGFRAPVGSKFEVKTAGCN